MQNAKIFDTKCKQFNKATDNYCYEITSKSTHN